MLWILEDIEQLDAEAVLSLIPAISEERRARIRTVRHQPTRVCSVLAELLLRRALREEYGLSELPRMAAGEKGKPFFPDYPDLHFNLSHCKTAVACALDASPVGVDVQEIQNLRRDDPLTAPSIYNILSRQERAWVEAGETPDERDRRFTAVWTCKEAWGKALGVGILYELKTTCFLPKAEPWIQHDFLFRRLSRDGYELTLCASAPLPCKSVSFEEIVNEVTL